MYDYVYTKGQMGHFSADVAYIEPDIIPIVQSA